MNAASDTDRQVANLVCGWSYISSLAANSTKTLETSMPPHLTISNYLNSHNKLLYLLGELQIVRKTFKPF